MQAILRQKLRCHVCYVRLSEVHACMTSCTWYPSLVLTNSIILKNKTSYNFLGVYYIIFKFSKIINNK